jgi:EmrB/QacA subfamily drug resistance transporter
MKNTKQILPLLFVGVLMGALDIAIIGPAFPAIQKAFNVSDRLLPWLLNIYVLFNLISTPVMGKLSDLYGRKWIYISAIFLFAMGSLVVVLATSFDMVMVGRAIQGLGAGGIFPVASAVIGDTIAKEKQGSALGLIGAVFGLAFIVGPIIGGALLALNWKYIFAINLPIALVLIIWAYKILPGERIAKKIVLDWKGLIVLVLSLSAYAYSVNKVDSTNLLKSFLSAQILPIYIFSVILLPIFYYLQLKSKSPVIDLKLLKSRQLMITYLIAFGAGMTQLVVIYIPSIAQELFKLSFSQSSFMMLPLVLAMFVSAPLAGKLIDLFGSRVVLVIGFLTLLVGLGIFSFDLTGITTFYLAEVFLGIGLGFILGSPLRYIMNRETTMNDRASGQAILTVFSSTGQISSAALTGAIIASMGGGLIGYQMAFKVMLAFGVLLLISTFGLRGRNAEREM